MKLFCQILVFMAAVLLISGCRGKSGTSSSQGTDNENTAAGDTGFTGVKKYKSGGSVVMETTFKNGIKEGLSTTFYENGRIKGTAIYRKGLRQDSAKWFFETGEVFRTTPYINDTVEGIQKQYYRNGKLKARIGYKKGLRTFEFEEFDLNGKKYAGYPDLLVTTKDDYNSRGTFIISLSTSDKNAKVKYYRGDLSSRLFDSTRCEKIKIINGAGVLELKKTGTPQPGTLDILASILSPYGNSYLVYKTVKVPYKDLK